MSFSQGLNQDITYWPTTGYGGFGSNTFGSPVTIKGRWEEKSELIRDKTGSEVVSTTRVYLNQDIAMDGFLFLGTSVAADPTGLAGAYEIRQLSKIPDLRNLQSVRVAFL